MQLSKDGNERGVWGQQQFAEALLTAKYWRRFDIVDVGKNCVVTRCKPIAKIKSLLPAPLLLLKKYRPTVGVITSYIIHSDSDKPINVYTVQCKRTN